MSESGQGTNAPDGEFFSRVYLRSATALRDSKRFRKRVHAWFTNGTSDTQKERLRYLLRLELGIEPPAASWGVLWGDHFEKSEIRDILDTLTLIHRVVSEYGQAEKWRQFVMKALQEESLGYVMDAKGGIRYAVDAEYERNRFAVIDGLGDPRYAAVKQAAESAFARLDTGADTKTAVRDMFEAAETLAKLMADSNEDLNERMVQRRLKPIAQKIYGDDPAAIAFADQMLEGFAKWVSAGHKYRHGHQSEEPISVPLDMAVAYVSAGASHLRFLLSLDQIIRLVG